MREIVLVGGGGHCCSVIDVIEQLQLKIRGILDLPALVGNNIMGYDVIGTDDDIPRYVDDCLFVVTLGSIADPSRRIQLHKSILKAGGQMATIISPRAYVSPHAVVGSGSVVLNFANVNALATVGCGCIINTGANIEHGAIIGDFCHISTGAIVNGDVIVGERSFVGSGSVIRNGLTISEGLVIPMGAIVKH